MLEILLFYESYLHSNVDNKNNNAWSQNKTDFYFDEAIACSDTHTRKYSWHFSEKRWQLISQTLAGKELISPTVSLELLTMALMCADLRHTIAQTRRLAAWKRAGVVWVQASEAALGSVAVNAAPAALIWPSVVFISHTISVSRHLTAEQVRVSV